MIKEGVWCHKESEFVIILHKENGNWVGEWDSELFPYGKFAVQYLEVGLRFWFYVGKL